MLRSGAACGLFSWLLGDLRVVVVPQYFLRLRRGSLRDSGMADEAVAGGDLAARDGGTCLGGRTVAVGCGLRPSRDCAALLDRMPAMALPQGACGQPLAPAWALFAAQPSAGAAGARIVHHEKERLRAGPTFASSPSARVTAGRGHRRGLDGPSMPPPKQKNVPGICLPAETLPPGAEGLALAGHRERRAAQGWGRCAQRTS